jgi:hypothetical protein
MWDIWSIDDYKRQWKEGLKRILVNDTSCLITDVPNLGAEPSVMIWELFKEGDMVYCQCRALYKDAVPVNFQDIPFTVETCYKFIGKRRPKNAIGVLAFKIEPEDFKISELWKSQEL